MKYAHNNQNTNPIVSDKLEPSKSIISSNAINKEKDVLIQKLLMKIDNRLENMIEHN